MDYKDTLACVHHKLEDRDGSSRVSEPLSVEFTAIHIFVQFCSEYIPSWDRGSVYQDGDYRSELSDFERRKDDETGVSNPCEKYRGC